MNVAEVEFLQAEAIERGIGTVPGTAQAHYNAGVKDAMQMYGPYTTVFGATDSPVATAYFTVSDAQVATYLATYPYGVAKPDKLEMIGDQMWVSHFMNWYEAWSDWRRSGYPKLIPVVYPGNSTNGTIPRKLRLPSSEVSSNPNYLTGATQPDKIFAKVWWDGGPEK